MIKVKAFSLYELIVVFLVSGIVLSMAYWTFMQFVSFSFSFKTDKEKQYEVAQISNELHQAFTLSEKVYKTQQGFILKNGLDEKEVWIKNEQLIFINEIHTIPMTLLNYQIYFNKEVPNNNELVDEVNITGVFAGDTLTLKFKKEYFAATLLNQAQ